MIPPTLLRASLRHLGRHRWPTALSVLGIALGVAVVVSIDLANVSARRAFRLSAEGVTGRATHQVVGGPSGLDEAIYRRLRVEAGVRPAAPVVEGFVGSPALPGRAIRLLGVDPLVEGAFRPYLGRAAGAPVAGLATLLTEPGAALVSSDTAREMALSRGDVLVLRVAGAQRTLRLVGLLVTANGPSRQALDGLVVTDIATAQEVLGLAGRLSRIDLGAPDGPEGERLLARAAASLPPGAEIVRAVARSEFVEQVTRAFSVNLTALSLLALLVGMFLIYNTMTFSVVQRRRVIGILRALGVTRGQVFGLLLVEVLLVGAVATGLGLGLGVVLGRGLVGLVTRTINDLYFVVAVSELATPPLVLAKGAALGLLATVLAALGPALEATAVPPGVAMSRAALEVRRRRATPRSALVGLGALLVGGILLVLDATLGTAYAGLFAVVLGFALLTPAAAVVLVRLGQPAVGRVFGLLGRMAARGVVASLSRTAVAIAALMVSVAATVGVGLMVGSFRQTVVAWLDSSLVADVYVSAPSLVGSRADSALDPTVVDRLRATTGVAGLGTYRGVRVQSTRGVTHLVALGFAPGSRRQFRFLEGVPEAIWPAFETGAAAIVSEPYAYRHRLRLGARLRLRTDRGERDFPVAGVFRDYGSDQGVVMVSRRTYDTLWDDRGVSSVGIFAAPGTDLDTLVGALRQAALGGPELLIRGNRTLREASPEIFDRTFAITGVLRILATLVAFVGVLSALMALALERGRELGVLRAQGLTPAQVWGLTTAQTGLMGLLAGVLALPVGIVLALVLIFVINRRSFGWTLEATIAPEVLLQAVGLAVLAAVLAGVYPAWRMARTAPAAALREE